MSPPASPGLALDPAVLPKDQRVALYGLMFAMAVSDGAVAHEEVELIYRSLDLTALSEQGRRKVHGFLVAPSAMGDLLAPLLAAGDAVRFAVMVQIVEIALADDVVTDTERAMLHAARSALGVRDDQLRAIESYVTAARATAHLDHDDSAKEAVMDRVGEVLSATGVPREAVAPLEAPRGTATREEEHDNVALRVGAAVYFAAARLFDAEGQRRLEAIDEERRARLVIANLQASIDAVRGRMGVLRRKHGNPNHPEIAALAPRLAALESLLARRSGPAAEAPQRAATKEAPDGPKLKYSDIRDDVRDADVMMFRGAKLLSRVLEGGARSAYSHAGIVVWWHRRAMLLQAEATGVEAIPLSVGIHAYHGVVDWYQVRPEYRGRADVMRIIEEAQRNLGLSYGGKDLMKTALNEVAGMDLPADCERPEALFCSQYVARCFRVGGLPLHPQADIATVPSEVALSPVLRYMGTIEPDLSASEARDSVDKA